MTWVVVAIVLIALLWLGRRFVKAWRRESARIDRLIADEAAWKDPGKSPGQYREAG